MMLPSLTSLSLHDEPTGAPKKDPLAELRKRNQKAAAQRAKDEREAAKETGGSAREKALSTG